VTAASSQSARMGAAAARRQSRKSYATRKSFQTMDDPYDLVVDGEVPSGGDESVEESESESESASPVHGVERGTPGGAPKRRKLFADAGGSPLSGSGSDVGAEHELDMPIPSHDELLNTLGSVFGHSEFRAGQLEAVERVLRGRNTLAVLPTGGGKSLCYQLPAAILPGLTVVVSPLLALMRDQMKSLPSGLNGATLSSNQSLKEQERVASALRAGTIKVLFVSPERLFSRRFVALARSLPPISLAVVDEAHCMSEWSHNFRPSYLRLSRPLFSVLRPRAVLGLTATLTARTEASVLSLLSIPRSGVVRAPLVRYCAALYCIVLRCA
jgi:superfamily II DNA helicase RecQ